MMNWIKNRCKCGKSNLALLLCTAAAAVGCSKEAQVSPQSDEYVYLEAGIRTFSAASEDVNALGAAEYNIRRVRLYAFDGDVLDNMAYFDNIPNNDGHFAARIRVKQTAGKTLYAIVNEPDDAVVHSHLALIDHPAAFSEAEYAVADYMTHAAYNSAATFTAAEFCLPMFGTLAGVDTQTATPETDIPVSMTVTRSLARVDVMVQKNADVSQTVSIMSTTRLGITNTRARGYIAPYTTAAGSLVDISAAATGPVAALTVPVRNTGDNGAAVRAFSFYTPERDCAAADAKLGFTLTGVDFDSNKKNYTVTIGNQAGNLLTKIERNRVHRIYCTFLNIDREVEVQLVVLGWELVDQSGSL